MTYFMTILLPFLSESSDVGPLSVTVPPGQVLSVYLVLHWTSLTIVRLTELNN